MWRCAHVRAQRAARREVARRGLSGLLRRGSTADAHAALGASLDAGLLAHLAPVTAVHPYRLEAQVAAPAASAIGHSRHSVLL